LPVIAIHMAPVPACGIQISVINRHVHDPFVFGDATIYPVLTSFVTEKSRSIHGARVQVALKHHHPADGLHTGQPAAVLPAVWRLVPKHAATGTGIFGFRQGGASRAIMTSRCVKTGIKDGQRRYAVCAVGRTTAYPFVSFPISVDMPKVALPYLAGAGVQITLI